MNSSSFSILHSPFSIPSTPTRIRTRNPSFEARHDFRFNIGAMSGRQGSRTLISVGRTALAERPGQPYPATFRKWTAEELNPDSLGANQVSYPIGPAARKTVFSSQ
jgi:hypothetical protein